MNSIFWLLFSPYFKLVTNSWNLHNRRLLKTRALVIEMEEDAISHALGLNYGIISECIIKYLALRNHYHMLCISSVVDWGAGMQTRWLSSSCSPEISLPHWATSWDKNEYALFVFTFTPGRPIWQMYHSPQAVLFVATAYNLRKANMRWQQVALEHRVCIHLRD